jgi:2-polyprenyl-3-methyl-5-hydroxy-6-metoxy-1,4-benzoquinol methylase
LEQTELDDFIRNTPFSGYQKITLPSGEVIPGKDRKPMADQIFTENLDGKTYLDVGPYYGFFLHEAIRRGASRAVGIEADPERFRIAEKLAGLWNGKIELIEGLVEEVECSEQFDVVSFLRVLHHVTDPVLAMKTLAKLCRGTLIVEFRQPTDKQFMIECFHSPGKTAPSRIGAIFQKAQRKVDRFLMNQAMKRIPMIGVASVQYHRTYYFTSKAFYNAFVVHDQPLRQHEPTQVLGLYHRCDLLQPQR